MTADARGSTAGAARRPVLAAVRVRWNGLAARERAFLAVMLLALAATAAWLLWLEPLLVLRARWQAELPRLQAQAQALQPLLRARQAQQAAGQAVPTPAAVRLQLQAAGLQQQVRIEARAGRWHLQVQAVPADALWNWLLPLLADPAVTLQQLQLQRTGDVDMPAARISGTIVLAIGSAKGGAP
ncbi:type II secretion system protein GspM [Stenotrophomonas sp. 24(2023)]|uniref:type II secretion system protein GspM n=1 Tax=Stenotrophomonas sp. 24(2023) TaxID=3068324 RepID=UPI0027E0BD14|nr:type II secretion system protein GspM [Stenotrophomonas sp. 24(2023)]WMJ69401.1 type II secretion system protein GspM [Stenotrophomonas sp. 24(2023)]